MGYLGLMLLFSAGVIFAQRLRSRRRAGKGKRPGYSPSGAAIGNALQNLQLFVQPQNRYVLQEQLLQAEENEDDDGTQDPKEHLLRQARRLQRGEDIIQLTALWSPSTTDLE